MFLQLPIDTTAKKGLTIILFTVQMFPVQFKMYFYSSRISLWSSRTNYTALPCREYILQNNTTVCPVFTGQKTLWAK